MTFYNTVLSTIDIFMNYIFSNKNKKKSYISNLIVQGMYNKKN